MPWFQPSVRLFQIKIDWELNGFSKSLINCFIFLHFPSSNLIMIYVLSPSSGVARDPPALWRIFSSFVTPATAISHFRCCPTTSSCYFQSSELAWPITRRRFFLSRDAKQIHTNAVKAQLVAAPFSFHSQLIAFGYSFSLFSPKIASNGV